jgi:hemerythrin superfamily protein
MNAIEFLIKEHDRVRRGLSDISDKSHHYETKVKMFHQLCQELIRHETMEHKVWYPHFRNKLNGTVKHLLTEEKNAETAIKQFETIKTQEAWEEKFSKFKKDVAHHAYEEEHQLFPEVKKILSEKDLEQIGKDMREFKNSNFIE